MSVTKITKYQEVQVCQLWYNRSAAQGTRSASKKYCNSKHAGWRSIRPDKKGFSRESNMHVGMYASTPDGEGPTL